MLSPTHPFQLVLGLVIWSVWFVALYGGLSVGCAVAPPDPAAGALTWLNALLLLLTLATTLLLVHWTLRCWRGASEAGGGTVKRFLTWVASGVHLTAAGATLAVGLPVIVFPPCV